jgi:hypothetical protein
MIWADLTIILTRDWWHNAWQLFNLQYREDYLEFFSGFYPLYPQLLAISDRH